MCYMPTIGVRELRQNASQYLERVRAGETIEVSVRGRVVARLVPALHHPWDALVTAGRVRRASDAPLTEVPPIAGDVALSRELEAQRADER
jgi:prevent-host-death family protein